MITANYAVDQGVTVYAVPGRVNDPLSEGTNDLIMQGAFPALSAVRIMEDLGIRPLSREKRHSGVKADKLSEIERKVYEQLSSDPQTLDDLCAKTGKDIVSVSEALIILEIRKLTEQFAPGHYVRTY